MRKFLVALALLLGVMFLLTRFAELHQVLAVFQRGRLVYLALALLIEGIWVYNLSAFYQSLYRVFGMPTTRQHMLKLVTAAYFLTIAAPSGGLSAMAVYISDGPRHGRSIAKVTVAAMLYIWFEYIGTLTILVLGLGELARRNHLDWAEVTASLILLAGALGIALLLYLGLKSASTLGRTLAMMARIINWGVRPLIHHDYLDTERAYFFSAEVAEGIATLRGNPRWVIWPLFYTLTSKALQLVILTLCFLAFEVSIDPGTLIASLSIAHLFLIVSPTPGGIGIVEGILALALRTLDVSLGDATVISLSYRGLSFWMPFLVGIFTFRMINHTPTTTLGEEQQPAVIEPVSAPVIIKK